MIREFILVSIKVKITTGILNFDISFIKFQSLVGTLDVVACLSFPPMNSAATGIAVYKALKVSVFSSDID